VFHKKEWELRGFNEAHAPEFIHLVVLLIMEIKIENIARISVVIFALMRPTTAARNDRSLCTYSVH